LHEELDDGTVMKPIMRTTVLSEQLHHHEINAFASQHLDKIIKI